MDSLTQITLGAAVGEVVLGRKLGNRAMFWGAVAGTIPDLDVFAGFFVSPIRELAIHRGFSHSILFSILGAFALAWTVNKLYKSPYHKYFGFVGWLTVPIAIMYFINRIFEGQDTGVGTWAGILAVFTLLVFWLYRRYFQRLLTAVNISEKEWRWFFFWTLFTHPLLDCFTTYGTQLFQPFSDYRVAFCNISVADPMYTIPFLTCVIIASFLTRDNRFRRQVTIAGIVVSSMYMTFTLFNKYHINSVWERSLADQNVAYSRTLTTPTILNNVLWYCLAETDEGFYHGQYSLFDKERKIVMEFTPKNFDLLNAKEDDSTIKILRWFSNGYCSVIERKDGVMQVNDMRFGSFGEPKEGDDKVYIFNFPLQRNNEGYYQMSDANAGPPPGGREEMMSALWDRIKGK